MIIKGEENYIINFYNVLINNLKKDHLSYCYAKSASAYKSRYANVSKETERQKEKMTERQKDIQTERQND
jgi:hypothetical protein